MSCQKYTHIQTFGYLDKAFYFYHKTQCIHSSDSVQNEAREMARLLQQSTSLPNTVDPRDMMAAHKHK